MGPADEPPPLELMRCPWTRWNSAERTPARFEQWLRDRQRWRESHSRPLPGLFARDRYALHQMTSLDPDVIRAETAAEKDAARPPYTPPGPVTDRPTIRKA